MIVVFPCHTYLQWCGFDCSVKLWYFLSYSLTMMWVGLSCVIVVFPCHSHFLWCWLVCSVSLWHFLVILTYNEVGWSVSSDCGIPWSYSLTMMWFGVQCVIVAFPYHTHLQWCGLVCSEWLWYFLVILTYNGVSWFVSVWLWHFLVILTYNDVGWSVVCDGGISLSYSQWFELVCREWLWHFLVILTYNDVGWSAVSDCVISWSCSLSMV